MRTEILLAPLLAGVLATVAAAQPPFPVGSRDFAFPNTTGRGSPILLCQVHYPARRDGAGAPILARPGGWPVVVFLHGFTALGWFYGTLARSLAREGYVVVAPNTAQFSFGKLVDDGAAMMPALRAANTKAGGFLRGALDLGRAAVAGHSMGGGAAMAVLTRNVGYRCGVGLAPIDVAAASGVTAPVCILHGTGDRILPYRSSGLALYQALRSYRGLKLLHLLDDDCNHLNVAGLFLFGPKDQAVWTHVRDVTLGFLGRYLDTTPAGLEATLGPGARARPHLRELRVEVADPELWNGGSHRLGGTARFRVAAEPGAFGLFAAGRTKRTGTPFGTLWLDPTGLVVAGTGRTTTQRTASVAIPIPNDAKLAGARLWLQAAGLTRRDGLRLTGPWELRIAR